MNHATQLIPHVSRDFAIRVERGKAKTIIHEEGHGAFCTSERHAAQRAKFRIRDVVLDTLHQRRRHRAKAVRLDFRGQVARQVQSVIEKNCARFNASHAVDVPDHAFRIELLIRIQRHL